jgi:hypothetical protein
MLVLKIFLVFHWFVNFGSLGEISMSEQTRETKSTNRAAAMAKNWAGRRAWAMLPVCCCGCDEKLDVAKNPEAQVLFKAGHDARLKSMLRKVLRGEARREDLPEVARVNLSKIKFVQADKELQKAFANPGQKARRHSAKGETA